MVQTLPLSTPPRVQTVAPVSRVRGEPCVAGDKSISHRAALFNAIAEGQAQITNYSPGGDCATTLQCLRDLGVTVAHEGSTVCIEGMGLRGLREPESVLDCGNSGTTTRLLTGLLAGQSFFSVLTGDQSLRRRPMARVAEPLRSMGARIEGRERGRFLPLAIVPGARLQGTDHQLPVASAQVKSALLLAGLYATGETVVTEPAASRDHTERMLSAMGAPVTHLGNRIAISAPQRLQACDVDVPGDLSSAAFWLTLGVLHPDAEIRVRNVGINPTRTGFLTILQSMGADLRLEQVREIAGEPVADIVARSSHLRGTTVEGALVPLAIDELPLVALLGALAEGETVVKDAAELRVKEADRIAVVAEGLQALGADVSATPDGWRVRGSSSLRAARVHSHGDHRLAMLFAIAGALGEGVEIEDAEAVSVSYPAFWDHLAEVSLT